MISFKGNTSSLAFSPALNTPVIIENFSIVPKGGGATANVYLISGIYNICIMPNNKVINAGESYEQEREVVVLATEQIKVQVSGNCDYCFNLINDQTP